METETLSRLEKLLGRELADSEKRVCNGYRMP